MKNCKSLLSEIRRFNADEGGFLQAFFLKKFYDKAMNKDMTQGKAGELILSFSLPLMIANVCQQLYNIVDTAVVGRFVGENALAAVGTTGSIVFFMCALVLGLNLGAGIAVSQYFGAKNFRSLVNSVSSLIIIDAILSALITAVGVLGAPLILKILSVPSVIALDAAKYMRICFAGTIFMVSYNASATILRSMGDSKTPFVAVMISSVVNVACNLLFVLVCGWGVAGVALGTILSQFFSALYCICVIVKNKNLLFNSEKFSLRFEKHSAFIIAKNGIPSALQSALICLGGLSVQGLVNSFGTQTIAAYTAVQRIDGIAIQVVVAIASSLSVYTGQNVGAGKMERIKDGLRATLLIMLISCAAIALLTLVFGKYMLIIFLDPATSQDSIEIGGQYLVIIGIAYIIAGVMNSYLNVIRGAGDVNVALFAGVAEVVARVVFASTLVRFFGTWGIWFATPLSWGCGCVIPVVRYYRGKWKK